MDPPGLTTWIHQDPPEYMDSTGSITSAHQDQPFGGRRSKRDKVIAILKLFDHREREREQVVLFL